MRGEPGMVMVLHPYGKDLNNYHLHILVTEGGLDEGGRWQSQEYSAQRVEKGVAV